MALVGGEKLDSHNLRDFLRIKDDDRHSNLNQSTSSGGGGGRNKPPGLTLNAILSAKRSPAPPRPANEPPMQRIESNRTLLDIIREDQTSGLGGDQRDGRRSWKQLREKIRLRTRGGGGSAWFSTDSIPASDVPISNNNHYNNRTTMMMTRRQSTRLNPGMDSAELTQLDSSPGRETDRASGRFEHTINEDERRRHDDAEEVERGGDALGGEYGAAEQPVRMSLMALLAENDRQMGLEGSAFVMGEGEEDVAEEESVSVAAVGEYNNCCVCMLRHKGAAFIPCGHTFCRLCSRELWAQRGNCPLCNNYILEILDIF
ncbi:hypothetical protein PHJA_001030100 [Phtheirospermum japonicum]|uniref:RING-type domain-containing protein n=1 Tax=Phtheirospermum japonicum TaxID=374723 RepID=A0A830BX30_9LAMI|nr:hypothetical protein PHJA_001030100 [Phtheirospermum japonicum]